MDPVAHTLFGATLAEAGLKEKSAMATAALLLGANAPDVDAVTMFMGADLSLWFRRGWTHGLPALLLWPFVITGVLMGIDRLRRKRANGSSPNRMDGRPDSAGQLRAGPLLAISFVGVWSHPVLDWLNTYGIRLLMPLDGRWFYGDTLFVIDPWMWLLMAAAVVLARSNSKLSVAGWVVLGSAATALIVSTDTVPVAAKITWSVGLAAIALVRWAGWLNHRPRLLARVCLALFTVYVVGMYAGSRIAVSHAETALASQGVEIERVMPEPQPARLFYREGVAASATHYYLFRTDWLDAGQFAFTHEPIPIQQPDSIVQAALKSPEIKGFVNWMRFPTYEVRPEDGGWRVIIRDLRYVDPGQESTAGIGRVEVKLKR